MTNRGPEGEHARRVGLAANAAHEFLSSEIHSRRLHQRQLGEVMDQVHNRAPFQRFKKVATFVGEQIIGDEFLKREKIESEEGYEPPKKALDNSRHRVSNMMFGVEVAAVNLYEGFSRTEQDLHDKIARGRIQNPHFADIYRGMFAFYLARGYTARALDTVVVRIAELENVAPGVIIEQLEPAIREVRKEMKELDEKPFDREKDSNDPSIAASRYGRGRTSYARKDTFGYCPVEIEMKLDEEMDRKGFVWDEEGRYINIVSRV